MGFFAHSDVQDNGPAYVKANCNKVIITDIYTTDYATANTTAKVGEAALVNGDFTLSGAAGAARLLTAALSGKSAGNALKSVADGTNLQFVFVDTVNSKVLWVTEESSNQAVVSGNPLQMTASPVMTINQPTA